jgi:hypothetical protein
MPLGKRPESAPDGQFRRESGAIDQSGGKASPAALSTIVGLGNRIPNRPRLNSAFEGEGAAIANLTRGDVTDENADHPTADQQPPVGCDEMHVDMSAGQQAHLAFRHQSRVGHVDDTQLAAGAQTDL